MNYVRYPRPKNVFLLIKGSHWIESEVKEKVLHLFRNMVPQIRFFRKLKVLPLVNVALLFSKQLSHCLMPHLNTYTHLKNICVVVLMIITFSGSALRLKNKINVYLKSQVLKMENVGVPVLRKKLMYYVFFQMCSRSSQYWNT